MIGYLRGMIDQLFSDTCYIDVQGIGYRVFLPASTREKLSVGLAVKLYTYLNVREDALHLFGFLTLEEQEMFLLLLSVNGVGPKMALSVLSAMKPDGVRLAIGRNDLTALTRINGVGKKTAERIVLELRDKIGQIDTSFEASSQGDSLDSVLAGTYQEALAALISLGYQQNEVLPKLKKHQDNGKSTEDLIRSVLREMGGR